MDEEAEVLQLKRGMGIADARAMYPSIEIIEADPDADQRLIGTLADWCDRYTPLVALDGTDGLFLDITGCAHLFGGERTILADIVSRFLGQGFGVRAGLASTPGAAWAAARFSSGDGILDEGQEQHFLEPLPLAALRLDPGTRFGLGSVGLRTVGSVMMVPRAPLARRFGATLLVRLDQALGRIEEVISPRLPVAPLSVERHFVEPIGLLEDIERLVLVLSTSLKRDLERRGEGARALELFLFRVDGAVSRVAVGASMPLRDPRLIGKLFHERLAALETSIDAGYGFDLVRLSAFATARFETEQGDLTGETASDDQDIALFADRVRARLGRDTLLRPMLIESHLPERAARLVPFDKSPPERVEPPRPGRKNLPLPYNSPPERPLRLFSHPEPIEVPVTEVPEGPPPHFRWRRALHWVALAEGPERIGPEWWLNRIPEVEVKKEKEREEAERLAVEAQTGRLTRDYFRVEDTDGHRFWLFREGLYGSATQPSWYMHGISA